jgi:hypothetical protein
MLRRIFGTKRDKVIGGWRKLHNEDLHNLYSSPNTQSSRQQAGLLARTAYCSTMKMEAGCSSEMSVNLCCVTQLEISENSRSTLHSHGLITSISHFFYN